MQATTSHRRLKSTGRTETINTPENAFVAYAQAAQRNAARDDVMTTDELQEKKASMFSGTAGATSTHLHVLE